MSAVPLSDLAVSIPWQSGFLAMLPAVQTHAKIQFRHLPSESREEATQEAIASACAAFQRLASRGRLHNATPGSLATYAVKHVRSGRHVGSPQDAAHDVLSPIAQRRHDVKVLSYHMNLSGGESWQQVAIAGKHVAIPDLAAFRIDFAEWLLTLTSRDRGIIAALVSGEGTGAVAGRFGISAGRASQLRRKYEYLWHAFQGEVRVQDN